VDLVAVATLTWNLVGASLFIGLPSDASVSQVCIGASYCVVPDNKQLIVLDWDGPVPYVKAQIADTWIYAVPYPAFTG